jgi:hypothetical protein
VKAQTNHSKLSRRDFLATTAASAAAAGMMGAGCMQENRNTQGGKRLAMCGLDCAACPAYIAYKTNDQALREKTAAEWSQQFHVEMKPADINCVGCLQTTGVQIAHCAQCEIRQCGLGRKVRNCAECRDYPCERLSKFIANVPPARANLEEVRRARRK